MLYHSLVVEAATPVTVLLGYHGFKDEPSLRAGLAKHLAQSVSMDADQDLCRMSS